MTLVLDILTTAAILYGVSAGLLIVFGVMKIINFAHGAFLTVGGYAALLVTNLGWNPWWSLPVAFAIGGFLGALVERLVMKPLYQRPLDAILATWGLAIVMGQCITLVFDRGVQFVQSPLSGAFDFAGASYSSYRLLMIPLSLAVVGVLGWMMNGSRLGLVTRAVIMNEDLARGLGINTSLVRLATFSLGAGLAGLAGSLITPLSSVDPNMGVPWLVNAFMIVMVSGVSLVSLGIACLVLGGAQVLVSTWANPILGGLTIVVLAALILRVRPEGFARG
ncbi:branched-chain amino acid ABC transporter permease [Comamonas sp. Z1]|jgi:branched-chain amino acid transport system permease protein|uniref:branched-chain amino acid ABC transporter permease n=1 Tax=Burkholderiales TaxID=80840 RepID=UPI0010F70874|nr:MULTISPECIES: branched-chain amino acid ABC transporter permease [Burkholderiales]MCA3183498.1 branched-chain amino acid ABC transporter permease [Cupriavidus sp.]MCA3192174.1 branched-chain amino acid ABC transporter permease [Cupriavidus sp.]MCA3234599.1 branched-chain amino acid ABC transporter permease [Cupriavidus sp.]QWE98095.1 branched-chain amino acid ABC transporter permease [Cupriavidus sp. EM10]TYK71168.1 branched-chain amino acid ABC transporter permease [Comamonas sp. Z1]